MNKRLLISALAAVTLTLVSCSPDESEKLDQQSGTVETGGGTPVKPVTPVNKEAIARAFAVSMTTSIQPIVEAEQIIEDFAAQLESDVDAIDQDELESMSEAFLVWTNAIGEYMEGAYQYSYTTDEWGYEEGSLDKIDWSVLESKPIDNRGIAFSINGNTLTVTGTSVQAKNSTTNSINASVAINLPSVTLADNTAQLSISNLTVTDAFQTKFSAKAGSIALSLPNDIKTLTEFIDRDEVVIEAMDFILDEGQIVFGGLITLAGEGSLSMVDNLAYQSYDDDKIDGEFQFDIAGSLTTSDGASFSTAAEGYFNYLDEYDGYRVDVDSELALSVDFTKANSSNTFMTADFTLDLDLRYRENEYNEATEEEYEEMKLTHVSDFKLTVGENVWGMKVGASADVGYETEEMNFSIQDSTNTEQVVMLEMAADGETDFDSNSINIGTITVDGESFANVIVDNDNERIIANFPNLADVVLLASEDFD